MLTSRRYASVATAFTRLTDQPGVERQPTIAPDGKTVVFVNAARGNSDLYLLRVGGRNTILLTEDSDADDCAPLFLQTVAESRSGRNKAAAASS